MKKYIATISSLMDDYKFKLYYNYSDGIIYADDDTEIYDLSDYDEEGKVIIPSSDKEIVEAVYALYNGGTWEIEDCIEYED